MVPMDGEKGVTATSGTGCGIDGAETWTLRTEL